MNFDNTINISIMFALIAFISPIITTIINNHYQLKLKKLDMYENEKRKTLSNFISACQFFMLSGNQVSTATWEKYYSALASLYIYFKIDNPSQFETLQNSFRKNNAFESNKELTKIVTHLSQQIAKE